MGIPPLYWGARFWNLLHYLCICLDAALRSSVAFLTLQGIAEFFRAFARLLPCGDCTTHFLLELQHDFSPAENRWPECYFTWSVDVRARVAKRMGRKEKTIAEVLPIYDAHWKVNAWWVLMIMGFAYPSSIMMQSFYDDVDFFIRVLARLVPTTFYPQVISSVLDRRTKQWCTTKASYLETMFELRQAHLQFYTLPTANSMEQLQHEWMQDLEKFITEYKEKEEKEGKERALLNDAKQKEEGVSKGKEEKKEKIARQDVKQNVKQAKVKPTKHLISLQGILESERKKKKRIENQKAEIAASAAGAAAIAGEGLPHPDPVAVASAASMVQPVPAPAPVPALLPMPIPLPSALRLSSSTQGTTIQHEPIQVTDSTAETRDFDNLHLSDPVPFEDDWGQPANEGASVPVEETQVFEDDLSIPADFVNSNEFVKLKEMETPVVADSSREKSTSKEHKKSNKFWFSFSGKDWSSSYWIIWVSLLLIAILLIGFSAAFTRSYAQIPAEEAAEYGDEYVSVASVESPPVAT